MNKSELVYCDFNMDRLEQAAQMTADSFEVNNQFTKQGAEKRQEVEARTVVFLSKIDLAMKEYNQRNGTSLCFIKMLLYRNQMVALVAGIDVHHFLEFMAPIIGPEEPLLKAFHLFQLQKFPKNSTLTAFLLTVHKDYMNLQVSKYLIQKCINDVVSTGFKTIIGGSTNPISRDIGLKIGGKLFKDVLVNRNGIEGHFYLMSLQVRDMLKLKPKL